MFYNNYRKWKWSRSVVSSSLRPVDCSPPSSSIHGILQARIPEWGAIPSPGDLPDPGIESRSPTLQANVLTSALPGKHKWSITFKNCESLYTSVTYNIIHQPYFSKYKQEKKWSFCPAWMSFPPLICPEISYLSFKMLTLLGIIPSNSSSLVFREWILILYSFCILHICLLLDTTIFVFVHFKQKLNLICLFIS